MRRTIFLQLAILVLAFAWPLDQLYRRSGYLIFGALLLIHLCIGFNRVPARITIYVVVIGLAFGAQTVALPLHWPTALLAMSAYLLIPLLTGAIRIDYEKFLHVFAVFKLVAVVYFLGLVLQFLGVESTLLVVTQTETAGEVHARYASFAGNPLLLGMYSFFAILVCLAEIQRRGTSWTFLVLGIAAACLYFSFARRYYVLALLTIAYFWWLRGSNRAYLTYAVYVSVFSLLVATVIAGLPVYARLYSIFDFTQDPSNVGRLVLWATAWQSMLDRPLLGLGVGTEGTIGQSEEEILSSVEEGTIAEMYFLKVGMEFGVVVAAFFLVWMLALVKASFRHRGFLVRATPLVGLAECVMGAALGSPFFAFPFWLAVVQMSRKPDYGSISIQERLPYQPASTAA